MIGVPARRGDGGHVDQRVAAGKGGDELFIFIHVGLDEMQVPGFLGLGGRDAVDADQVVALLARLGDDGAADAAG